MNQTNRKGWDPIEISPIRNKVFDFIKNAILKGELKTGEKIDERELAERLNISRTPIREALFGLESVGLVKKLPRRGVVVNRITTEEIVDIFRILTSLEILNVRLAIQNQDEAQKAKLDELVNRIDKALIEEYHKDYYTQFHLEVREIIHESAKSPRLHELLRSHIDYIRAFTHFSLETPERRRKAFEEHRDIAIAVRNGEVELAENLVHTHLENSKKSYLDQFKKDNIGK